MKKIAGPLRTDQAEYKDLEAFAKFGSDLDPATQNVIDKGRRNVELLKQGKNSPLKVEEEIAVIYAGTQNLLKGWLWTKSASGKRNTSPTEQRP